MNTFKNTLLIGLALCGLTCTALAQRGNDAYAVPRTVQIAPLQNLTVNAGVGLITNSPVDIRIYSGVSKITFMVETNTGTTGGTLTGTLYQSTDQTNWIALANYALSTKTTIITTNLMYGGTNLLSTNVYILPGVQTIPTAATAGFATPYFAQAAFTNTGAITLTTPGIVEIGINTDDDLRYLQLVFTAGGSVTNYTVGAALTGYTHLMQLQ